MNCPKCGSEHTQRLEIIYENGTHAIDTKSGTIGAGFGGGFGAGGAKTQTKGTSQSTLAKKAAPPEKKSHLFWLLCGFFSFAVFAQNQIASYLIGLLLLVLAFFLAKTTIEYNSKEYPKLRKDWENSWMCQKCGNIYIHDF